MFFKFIKKILKILGFFLILSLTYGEEIKVVIDDSFPPYSFRDKKGKIQGITVDRWREFEKTSGIRVNLQGVAFSEAQEKVKRGEADIIDLFFYSKIKELYNYSKQKEDIEVALFYNKEIVSIGSIEEMKSYDIAVRKGETTADFLIENGVKNVIQYSNYDEIIKAAKYKKIKVFCMNVETAKFLISKNKMENEFIHGITLFKGKMHFAVYGNKTELLKKCDYWFGKISSSENERIIKEFCKKQEQML